MRWFTGRCFEFLRQPAWPANRGPNCSFLLPDAQKHFFGVLGKKAGTGLQIFRLAKRSGFDRDSRSDGVAIAFLPSQAERDRVADIFHAVVQDPQLRRIPVFQNDF